MTDGQIFAAVAVVSALAVAFAANHWVRRRADTAPLDLHGISSRVVFFSDEACRRCPAARDTLTAAGVGFEEIAYGDDPKRFRATGAPAVPLVVVRGADLSEVGRIAGEVRSGELRGLLRRAGL